MAALSGPIATKRGIATDEVVVGTKRTYPLNMSLNYEFLVEQSCRLVGHSARILDYGCCRGQLVAAAAARGFDAHGCDSHGSVWQNSATETAAPHRIRTMDDTGTIPFDDGTFDIVIANQVFEHISSFARPLSENHRVLRSGGLFLNCFPTMEIWFEGHVNAPFAQHFFPNSNSWRRYLIVMHHI